MNAHPVTLALSLSTLTVALLATAGPQQGGMSANRKGGGAATDPIPFTKFDNLKDRSVHWNAHLIDPIKLSPDGSKLYAINQGGARLAVFQTASMQKIADIPAGPGLVSMAFRQNSNELWLVDKATSTVSVVDVNENLIRRSIRVGAEPHGIAFSSNADRAYVACSGVNRVDVISTATYAVATSIPIPAKNPRALVHRQGVTWVAPLVSGNNTAPLGAASSGPDLDKVVGVAPLASFPALNQLPDRDLLAIPTQSSPDLDALAPGMTITGLGTMLLNLYVRPGTSELWIPNTEALNAVHKGEKNFVAGQCVRNRITIVDVSGAQPVRFVDLDSITPTGMKCSQPTGLAFDPVRPRVYVCGYGNDLIAVLDTSGPQVTWRGTIDLPYINLYPELTSPRACVVDAQGQYLYVLNKGDTSISRVDLTQLPTTPGFQVTAPTPGRIGWDSVTGAERFGRNDLVNGRNSKSQTTSCASCHVDGHHDGTVWNLGKFLDPEGTPNGQLSFPLDDKGPMVTQSVRRLFETGPYHWRGERSKLTQFNGAFIDLMEREENGVPTDLGLHFHYIDMYMRRVSYPVNPRQNLDRSQTPQQLHGEQLFKNKQVSGNLTCASCHTLPLGTSGEIVASHVRGVFGGMADVPQLRGVADKLTPPYFIGGNFGTRTELGGGLSHGGAFATIQDLLLAPHPTLPGQDAFDLTPGEADDIAAFLSAFDTGLAPATGYQATANTWNAGTFAATELDFLISQANKGNCDLIVRRRPQPFHSVQVWPSCLYNPATGKFRVAQAGAAEIDAQTLMLEASQGRPVTFIGVPLWMGLPMALDRDLDQLLDLDEIVADTDPESPDTDLDTFPDGYELQWGMNPLVPNTVSPDVQAPTLVSQPQLMYATTNTIKFEIELSELSRIDVSVDGTLVQRLPLESDYDTQFSIILNGLEPGTSPSISLDIRDPAKNHFILPLQFSTRARVFPAPAHITDFVLAVAPSGPGQELAATIELSSGDQPSVPGYVVSADVYFRAGDGALSTIATGVQGTLVASDGRLTLHVPLPAIGSGNPGELFFAVRSVSPPAGAPGYAQPLNVKTWDSIAW